MGLSYSVSSNCTERVGAPEIGIREGNQWAHKAVTKLMGTGLAARQYEKNGSLGKIYKKTETVDIYRHTRVKP